LGKIFWLYAYSYALQKKVPILLIKLLECRKSLRRESRQIYVNFSFSLNVHKVIRVLPSVGNSGLSIGTFVAATPIFTPFLVKKMVLETKFMPQPTISP
jgi:hypothetical protein